MTLRTNRRDFLKTTSAVAAAGAFGVWSETPAAESKSPNEKLNIAFVGVANKGGHNVQQLRSQNVYALCDVDSKFLGKAANGQIQAKTFRDFRKMLEAVEKNVDAVCVSTADHSHAPATSLAG